MGMVEHAVGPWLYHDDAFLRLHHVLRTLLPLVGFGGGLWRSPLALLPRALVTNCRPGPGRCPLITAASWHHWWAVLPLASSK